MDENKVMGMRIRKLREQKRLSRERLAESATISTQFLADIETGKKGMSVTSLKRICDALGTTANYIIYGECGDAATELERILSPFDNETQSKIKTIVKEIADVAGRESAN